MPPVPSPLLMWLMLVSFAAMATYQTWALLSGKVKMRVRRGKGDIPHCPECDYCVIGLPTDRCSECGTKLNPDALRYGKRRWNVWGIVRIGATAALWVWVLAGVVHYSKRETRYSRYPTSTLIGYVQSAQDPECVGAAWRVLSMRSVLGRLSVRERRQLVEACLKVQASAAAAPVAQEMVDFLDEQHRRQNMTPAQRERFFTQLLGVQLHVDPPAGPTGRVRFARAHRLTMPVRPSFWLRLQTLGIFLDGEQIDIDVEWDCPKSLGNHIDLAADCTARGSFPCTAPGTHRLKMLLRLEVYSRPPSMASREHRVYEQDLRVTDTFHVPGDGG